MSALTQGPSGRVVVTGLGAVTPLGVGVDTFWPRLLAGESGIERIQNIDPTPYATQVAGECLDFDASDWLEKKEARRVDRFIAFAVAAAAQALKDANLELTDELRDEFGVMIGSGIGGLTFMGEQMRILVERGPDRVSPFWVPYMIADMASGYVSIQNGLKGPNSCVVTACSTGANAIGDAYHIVKRGDAVAMLAGGTEAPVNEIGVSAFSAARAVTTSHNDDPRRASKPFDLNRDGFVIAEGSAVLVLEDYAFAKARGARIYGEVVGYGMSGDAFHITQPHPEADGAIRAMKMALRTSGVKPEQIGYINAHGTSTPYNDRLETLAIRTVLGEQADKIPVSSTKSAIGHTLGAAGAIEALICLKAMEEGKLPPTINYETPDPDCDLDYVPNTMREAEAEYALSNSFGFGGHNVTLVLKRGA
ncbi:MAG TPA: beta-ketoacyl-ACP synthase II [Fimbriimonas sp.]